MKTLTLLRHAKSGWDNPGARDFDRALNPRGQLAAKRIGRYIRDEGLEFDLVLASPAVRVVETLDHLAIGLGAALSPVWERRIYLASAATLLDLINALPTDVGRVMMIGHNPGLEDLVLLLAAAGKMRSVAEEKFPTAALAELHLDAADWADVSMPGGTLTRFIRPRDLDPALGPDDD